MHGLENAYHRCSCACKFLLAGIQLAEFHRMDTCDMRNYETFQAANVQL